MERTELNTSATTSRRAAIQVIADDVDLFEFVDGGDDLDEMCVAMCEEEGIDLHPADRLWLRNYIMARARAMISGMRDDADSMRKQASVRRDEAEMLEEEAAEHSDLASALESALAVVPVP